jgi:hypothetical protein
VPALSSDGIPFLEFVNSVLTGNDGIVRVAAAESLALGVRNSAARRAFNEWLPNNNVMTCRSMPQ